MYLHEEFVHNTRAAFVILPLVMEKFKIASMIDIGCGIGTWLSVAKKLGVSEVKGVDANYVDRNLLRKHLLENEFITHDLNLPLDLGKKFDFCLCLEVAEHLPENTADILVDSLVRHSDLILFSAAIPSQGGQNHINEQDPQFWIDKFTIRGYNVYDSIRPLVWNNDEVDIWYKQNIFLFSKSILNLPEPCFKHIIHPELYISQIKKKEQYLSEINNIKNGKYSALFYLKRFIFRIIGA